MILILLYSNCISLQEKPASETSTCISSIFSLNRNIREIQITNRLIQSAIYAGSWAAAWVAGPSGLSFALLGIYFQLKNKHKSDELIENWKKDQCHPK
ncbi:MAG: hypothetical protein L6Q54_05555 [Leptospiraceae bacterium]|nr:hypothetical protein [Leptospiraceae bacterium]